jgi:hypothetical protein
MIQKIKIRFVLIFSLLISFDIYAQTDSSSTTSSIDLVYGYRIFNGNFYNQFSTTNHYDYKLPVQLAGIAISDNYFVNQHFEYYGHISYCQVIPQTIQLPNTNCKISGFVFGVDYGISVGSKIFKLLIGAGFNTGRLKLSAKDQIDLKNPFFSPKVCIQPKIAIKKFVISVRAEYDLDISNTKWYKTSSKSVNTVGVSNFKQTCFTPFFCIGIII